MATAEPVLAQLFNARCVCPTGKLRAHKGPELNHSHHCGGCKASFCEECWLTSKPDGSLYPQGAVGCPHCERANYFPTAAGKEN